MNVTKQTRAVVAGGLCAAILVGAAPVSVVARDGAWASGEAGGSWATAANWVGSEIPGGVDSTVVFPKATAAGDLAVTLDGDRTVGTLIFDLSGKKWVLKPGSGGVLTLDTGAGRRPRIVATNGVNRAIIDAGVAGTNGFVLSGTDKARLEFTAANTYSGVTRVEAAYFHIRSADALGQSHRVELTPSTKYAACLYVAAGATLTNAILLHGNETENKGVAAVYTEIPSGVADPTVRLNGPIVVSGNNVSPNQISNEIDADLVINGPIAGDGTPGSIGLRGAKGRIIVNGTIDIGGALVKNDANTCCFNTSGNTYGADLVFYSGLLVMGAERALCPLRGVSFTRFGSEATLDLNGHDQTVQGLLDGHPSHRITSAAPATLTLDTNGRSCDFSRGGTIDGAVRLVKTGEGSQQFGASNTNVMSGGTFVCGGTFTMNGLTRANITVDGGKFAGTGTLLFRLDGIRPDCVRLLGGTLDISAMPVVFAGEPPYGTCTILDCSAAGEDDSFVPALTDHPPFHSVSGLPGNCKIIYDEQAKKAYLIKPRPATLLIVS